MKITTVRFAFFAALGLAAPLASHASSVISLNKPVTGTGFYNSGTETFTYQNITDGLGGDTGTPGNWSFWLTPQGQMGSATIDLQGQYNVDQLDIQDTHNRGYYDRGTQDFDVSVSNDGVHFTNLLTDSFTNAEWVNLTTNTYNSFAPVTARYVKFNVDSLWGGQSGGINELTVYGSPAVLSTPEPGSVAALALGALPLAGLILRRRKLSRA